MYCAHCGEKVDGMSGFCGKCGLSVASGSEVSNKQNDLVTKKENRKRWFFLVLTLLTVLIPNIIAWQFNKEFVFGYPIGEEYGMAKGIAALFALGIIGSYIASFKINHYFKFLIVLLSILPIFRLYIATYLFFTSVNKIDSKESDVIPPKPVLLDTLVLFAGFWCIYLVTLSVVPLLAQVEVMNNLVRVLAASLIFYYIQRRYFSLNNPTLISFLLLGLVLYFFPII